MTRFATQVQRFGLAKETTRGTAEAAPSIWIPTRGLAKLNYQLKHHQDQGIRGAFAKMPPIAGQKMADGTIPLTLDAQTIGQFIHSLLGAPTSAIQGATAAYKHTFVRGTSIQPQSFTGFLDRSQAVLKYNLLVAKKLSVKGNVDGLTEVDVDVLAKGEASGSIGTPSFSAPQYAAPHQLTIEIDDVAVAGVKDMEVSIDNGARHEFSYNQSQECDDILAVSPLDIKAGFTVLFESATERDKFLANTGVKLEFNFIGATIASTYKYTTSIILYKAHYTAHPYEEAGGILAAKAQLDGFYSTSDGKDVQIEVTNTATAY